MHQFDSLSNSGYFQWLEWRFCTLTPALAVKIAACNAVRGPRRGRWDGDRRRAVLLSSDSPQARAAGQNNMPATIHRYHGRFVNKVRARAPVKDIPSWN